jgi:glycosyltransferase involved in cell wall biosynthesis
MSEHSHPQLEPDPKDAPVAVAQSPEVTVLVPALDEQDTIGEVIERLLALPLSLEVIVVDDGSTDRTPEILASFGDRITVLRSPAPRSGKGSAIRQGLEVAQGEVIVIQDADLEYRPEEIPALVAPILAGEANVVYGTRFSHGFPRGMALPNKIVNKLLVWAVGLLYFRRITDEATCYKAIRRSLLLRMHLVCRRFEFCPEVTAKAFRLGERIVEMPIHYEPRTKAAGKKIRWTDAPVAFWTLLRHRFGRF